MSKGFDLGSLDTIEACNKPAEIEIKHPVSGEGTGVFISVLGRDSTTYRTIVRGLADETLKRRGMGKAVNLSLDKIEQKDIDALVAVTTGWRTEVEGKSDASVILNGDKLEFTPANAKRLYTDLLPVRDQVWEALNNLENFMQA